MLLNYQQEADEIHQEIKKAVLEFQNGQQKNSKYIFLDFEAFPKFEIINGCVSSKFFTKLLNRVVRVHENNKFNNSPI